MSIKKYKLPRHFNVLGEKVRIYNRPLPEGVAALYLPDQRKILIDLLKAKSESWIVQTLMHELTHAWFDIMNFEQFNFPREIEELVCEGLSQTVCKTFKVSL